MERIDKKLGMVPVRKNENKNIIYLDVPKKVLLIPVVLLEIIRTIVLEERSRRPSRKKNSV